MVAEPLADEFIFYVDFFSRTSMKKDQLWTDLSDEQCQKVVGGAGRGDTPQSSAGFNGWGADGTPSAGHGLFSAGFKPGLNPNANGNVWVPNRP